METRQYFESLMTYFQGRIDAPAELFVGSVEDVLERINLISNPEILENIQEFARRERKLVRLRLSKTRYGFRPSEYDDGTAVAFARELALLLLLDSAAFRYPDEKPVRHHWLPACYMRSFSDQKSRTVEIKTVNFDSVNDCVSEDVISDEEFIHSRRSNGSGYYDLAVEKYFSLTEAYYSEIIRVREDINDTRDSFARVHSLIFLMSIAVRNPNTPALSPSGIHTVSGLVKQLIHVFDSLGEGFVTIREVDVNLPFTSEFAWRQEIMLDGEISYYAPLSSHHAFLFTKAQITPAAADEIIMNARSSTIASARNSNGKLHGLQLADL